MLLFNILTAMTILSSDAPAGLDRDGWYTIPKPTKEVQPIGSDERDLSVWTTFSKTIGSEKMLIALPAEPVYRYTKADGSELEVYAARGTVQCKLQVLNKTAESPQSILQSRKQAHVGAVFASEKQANAGAYAELVYWKDGFWYHESVISSPFHTYLFQTKSLEFAEGGHDKFVSSLDLY